MGRETSGKGCFTHRLGKLKEYHQMSNLDFIFDVIAEAKAPDWDKECVLAGALRSIDHFFAERDQEYKIEAVELSGDVPIPHRIDLYLTREGEHKAVDWKFKRRMDKLDDIWALRESRSWQPKIYAAALADRYGSEIFPLHYEVRGVAAEFEEPDRAKIKVVSLKLHYADAVQAIHYLEQLTAERTILIEDGKWPWVRNPDGCRCFGPKYPCAFEADCWEGRSQELDFSKLLELKPLSHSSAKEYLRCPQRYALLKLLGKPEEDDEVSAAGILFHKVMESVYKIRISETLPII